ncbi:DUF4169 family protein [Tateyamaria sp.]|uniref:DUF4169 family protein n=1 Tax=Tateyamaria sp. TaxID=1929288 RepID=UPI00329C4FC5
MSSSPINLNKARKARARADQKARATENSIAFGRSKAAKASDTLQAARNARILDGVALETPDGTKHDKQKPQE